MSRQLKSSSPAHVYIEHARKATKLPDAEFVAAAGRNYGWAKAWKKPNGRYAVEYSRNGITRYAVITDMRDLAALLEDKSLRGADRAVHMANIRGIEAVKAADPEDDGPFAVLMTRHYYGPREKTCQLLDVRGAPMECTAYEDAMTRVAEEEDNPPAIEYGECASPTFTIVCA